MKTFWKPALLGALLFASALAASYFSGEAEATGQLAIGLTDAPIEELGITEVWVTIKGISVHRKTTDSSGEWIEPAAGVSFPLTVDLLKLCDDTMPLGLSSLPAGEYTQVRLHLAKSSKPAAYARGHRGKGSKASGSGGHPFAHYVVLEGGDEAELIVPSGSSSGIKLIHGFKIEENANYGLTLDFDAASSIHRNRSGRYILRPTIRAIKQDAKVPPSGNDPPQDPPPSDPTGWVTATEGCMTVEGVTVTVQDDAAQIVHTTLTDAAGIFEPAYLPAGTYNLVAYKDDPLGGKVGLGLEPAVVASLGDALGGNITMQCFPRLKVSGGVMLIPPTLNEMVPQVVALATDGSGHQYVAATTDTTWSTAYAAYLFDLGLPAGSYTFVFQAEGYQTKTVTRSVSSDLNLTVMLSKQLILAP